MATQLARCRSAITIPHCVMQKGRKTDLQTVSTDSEAPSPAFKLVSHVSTMSHVLVRDLGLKIAAAALHAALRLQVASSAQSLTRHLGCCCMLLGAGATLTSPWSSQHD